MIVLAALATPIRGRFDFGIGIADGFEQGAVGAPFQRLFYRWLFMIYPL